MSIKARLTLVLTLSNRPFGKHPEFLTNSDFYETISRIIKSNPDVKEIELEHMEKLEAKK